MSFPRPVAPPSLTAERAIDQSDFDALQEFIDEGVVTEVVGVLKAGKEATAFHCRAHPSVGPRDVVAKVYRTSSFRDFHADSVYHEGDVILNGQVRRAVAKKTAAGREFAASMWVNREFDALSTLADAGADVPEPFFATDRAILMALSGTPEAPAPQLQHARLDAQVAPEVLRRILWNIELMLDQHLVHADLSPFNILIDAGRPVIIDLPQAVDPRKNGQARRLLERDLGNVCRFFRRFGIEEDGDRVAAGLWNRYRFGDLG